MIKKKKKKKKGKEKKGKKSKVNQKTLSPIFCLLMDKMQKISNIRLYFT